MRLGEKRSGGSSVDTLVSSTYSSRPSLTWAEDENKERGNWTGKLDFILSCIGYAVGFGNVWRFPYLCYRNGGGAFLIPYALMLAFAGLPLFFMELAFGQYASLGPISIWKISPLFKGVGYAMVTISGLVCIYYNIILTYVIFYFFSSFASEVPWAHCNNPWNTPNCTEIYSGKNSSRQEDLTGVENSSILRPTSPAEEYWERHVLELTPGIDQLGTINWKLALCLVGAWLIVFFCLIKGIKSTGKVVYFTATFPYVVLAILLVRGASLPGSLKGVKFYITPTFDRLGSPRVWGDAAIQIFYSLGPGWGGLITMASYNRFHNNCYRDAIIVAVVNCGTSVFAGFVIFSVIGFMAHELGVDVEQVTADGPGLAFVAYPEGLARMPAAPFWSILFFFMLITLGLDSMFAMLETVISLRPHKSFLTMIVCIIGFLLGLPQVTQGGMYIMNLMDQYAAAFPLLIVALLEVLVIMHVYGYNRFATDIESMVGFRPNVFWKVTWLLVTPLLIIFIIVFNATTYKTAKYNDYTYPEWAEILGWMMAVTALIPIPIAMLMTCIKEILPFKNFTWYVQCPWTGVTLRRLAAATPGWGPALQEHNRIRHQHTQTNSQDYREQVKMQSCENQAMQWDFPIRHDVMYESYI